MAIRESAYLFCQWRIIVVDIPPLTF